MQGVHIVINDEGKVVVEWEGFRGNACYTEAEKLYNSLKAMGVDVEVREIKPVLSMGKERIANVAISSVEREMGGI